MHRLKIACTDQVLFGPVPLAMVVKFYLEHCYLNILYNDFLCTWFVFLFFFFSCYCFILPVHWCVGGRGGPSPSHTLQTTIFYK